MFMVTLQSTVANNGKNIYKMDVKIKFHSF